MNRRPFRTVALLYSAVIVLLHVLGTLSPGGAAWGFHHFGFLPVPASALILTGMFTLLLPGVQSAVLSLVEKILRLWDGVRAPIRRMMGWGTLGAGLLLTILARQVTFFLGDGYYVIRTLAAVRKAAAIPIVFSTAPASAWIALQCMNVFSPGGSLDSAQLAWQSLSILSGVVFVFAAWRLSGLATPDRTTRLLFMGTLVAGGYIQLFFSYVETYPPSAAVMLVYLWLALSHLRGVIGLVAPTIAFSLLVMLHVSTLVIVPTLLYLYVRTVRRGLLRNAVVSFFSGVAVFFLILWGSGGTPTTFLNTVIRGNSFLLPITPTSNWQIPYGVFSAWHFVDVANLFLLLSPLSPLAALLVAFDLFRKARQVGPGVIFGVLFGLSAGAWCTLFNFELGLSRDWDAVAPLALGIVTVILYAWFSDAEQSEWSRRWMTAFFLLTALHTTGWITVNAGRESSLRRAESLPHERLWAQRARASMLEEIASYHRRRGDLAEAEAHLAATVAIDSTNGRRWSSLGYLFEMERKPKEAIGAYYNALRHSTRDKALIHSLAIALYHEKRIDEAIGVYRDWLAVDTSDTLAAFNLGVFFQQGKRDHGEAIRYLGMAVRLDSSFADAYKALADSYSALGRKEESRDAAANFNRFTTRPMQTPGVR